MKKYLNVKTIFLVGIFLLPFIYWLPSRVSYEIPRVWFFNRWVELLAASVLFFPIKEKKIDISLILIVSVFVFWNFLTSIVGVNFDKSFWGNYYRADGLWTLFHLASLFFVLTLVWEKSWKKLTIKTIALSSLVVSIWVLIYAFRLFVLNDFSTPNWYGEIGVSFGNPNFLAGFLLVTLPFLISLKYKFHAIVVQLTAIFFTQSYVSFFIAFSFLFLLFLFKKKSKTRIIIGLALVVIVGIFMKPEIDSRLFSYAESYKIDSRERIYKSALNAIKEKPFLGYGLANFDIAFDKNAWPKKFKEDIYVDKAHSHFLEIMVSGGIFGLLIYLGLVIKGGWKLFKYDRIFFYSFLLFLFHSQTNVISISEEAIFWILLGTSAARLKN